MVSGPPTAIKFNRLRSLASSWPGDCDGRAAALSCGVKTT